MHNIFGLHVVHKASSQEMYQQLIQSLSGDVAIVRNTGNNKTEIVGKGTIINRHWIITAKSIFEEDLNNSNITDNYSLILAAINHDLANSTNTLRRSITDIIQAPDDQDVVLVHVEDELVSSMEISLGQEQVLFSNSAIAYSRDNRFIDYFEGQTGIYSSKQGYNFEATDDLQFSIDALNMKLLVAPGDADLGINAEGTIHLTENHSQDDMLVRQIIINVDENVIGEFDVLNGQGLIKYEDEFPQLVGVVSSVSGSNGLNSTMISDLADWINETTGTPGVYGAPPAPTGLKISQADGYIRLTWNDVVDNPDHGVVASELTYEITRVNLDGNMHFLGENVVTYRYQGKHIINPGIQTFEYKIQPLSFNQVGEIYQFEVVSKNRDNIKSNARYETMNYTEIPRLITHPLMAIGVGTLMYLTRRFDLCWLEACQNRYRNWRNTGNVETEDMVELQPLVPELETQETTPASRALELRQRTPGCDRGEGVGLD